mmetsp:Transcript_24545/g.84736  ORF Transcript_24545/g.84736 Transcript_24545/m.84736 type:complete len:280 (+) Transcript_24545:93-932(+)
MFGRRVYCSCVRQKYPHLLPNLWRRRQRLFPAKVPRLTRRHQTLAAVLRMARLVFVGGRAQFLAAARGRQTLRRRDARYRRGRSVSSARLHVGFSVGRRGRDSDAAALRLCACVDFPTRGSEIRLPLLKKTSERRRRGRQATSGGLGRRRDGVVLRFRRARGRAWARRAGANGRSRHARAHRPGRLPCRARGAVPRRGVRRRRGALADAALQSAERRRNSDCCVGPSRGSPIAGPALAAKVHAQTGPEKGNTRRGKPRSPKRRGRAACRGGVIGPRNRT